MKPRFLVFSVMAFLLSICALAAPSSHLGLSPFASSTHNSAGYGINLGLDYQDEDDDYVINLLDVALSVPYATDDRDVLLGGGLLAHVGESFYFGARAGFSVRAQRGALPRYLSGVARVEPPKRNTFFEASLGMMEDASSYARVSVGLLLF